MLLKKALLLTTVALSILLIAACGSDNSDDSQGQPEIVTNEEVGSLPEEVGHKIYWVGPRAGKEIEFSYDPETLNNHVRYLNEGVEAGAENNYLDIGTYPFDDALTATKRLANQGTLKQVSVTGKAKGFYNRKAPTSVYLVFPDQPNYQVEVFHPAPGVALRTARSGAVVPIP